MSARHRRPQLPQQDGTFAGVVLAAVNFLGLSVVTYAAQSAPTPVAVPDPSGTPDAGPVLTKKDSGPA